MFDGLSRIAQWFSSKPSRQKLRKARRNMQRRFVQSSLEVLESRALLTAVPAGIFSGNILTDTEFLDTGAPYVVNGTLTVASGVKLTVGSGVTLTIRPGFNQLIPLNVNGTLLVSPTADVQLDLSSGLASASIVVGATGTLQTTSATYTQIGSGGAIIDVQAGGRFVAKNNTFALTNVNLSSSAVIAATDIDGNAFDSTLTLGLGTVARLSAAQGGRDNLRFRDINIQGGNLTSGTVNLTLIGTETANNLRYVFPAPLTINAGATLNIASSVQTVLKPSFNTLLPLTVNGSLNIAANANVNFDTTNGLASASIVVGATGTFTTTGASFVSTGTGGTTIDVQSSGRLIAKGNTFGISNVTLSSSALINSTDIDNNAFDTTLTLGIGSVAKLSAAQGGKDNKRFRDINIQGGNLTSGTVNLTLIGTEGFNNLRYVFPAALTINAGAQLNVASTVQVMIKPNFNVSLPITVNGTLNIAANANVSYDLTNGLAGASIVVGATGLFSTTSATYSQTGSGNASIDVLSSGRMIAKGNTFSNSNVNYDSAALINSTDIENNAFDTILTLGIASVPKLSASQGGRDNRRFKDVQIQGGNLPNGNVRLAQIGTEGFTNLRYVFISPLTVDAAAQLTIENGVQTVLRPNFNTALPLTVDGALTINTNAVVNLDLSAGLAGASIVVGSGGAMTTTGASFTQTGNGTTVIAVQGAGKLTAYGATFQINVSLEADSLALLQHNQFVGAALTIDGNNDANVDIRFNDFSTLGAAKVTLTNSTNGSADTFDLAYNFWGTVTAAAIDTLVVDDEESALRPTATLSNPIPLGSIGHRVWKDIDHDGLIDPSEPGVPGITFKAFDASNDQQVGSTTTDAQGRYSFSGLATGNYYVTFTLSDAQRQIFGPSNILSDFIDSDTTTIANLTGRSSTFFLGNSNYNYHMDAGLWISEPPVIGGLGTVNYTENAPLTSIAPSGVVSDTDSLNFGGGKLTVTIAVNGGSSDQLGILAGSGITLVGSEIRLNNVAIGTFSGGTGTAPLVIDLVNAATVTATQQLLRNIGYRANSDNPSTLARTINFVLKDGDGGTSNVSSATVNITAVNDIPVVTLDANSTYTENSAPTPIAPNATVVDVDSSNFATGKLTIQFTAGASAGDALAIRNQGTVAGQIGVAGADVSFGGAKIGTFALASGVLTITFNASATPAAAQALLRNIVFTTPGNTPSTNARVVQAVLTDGDGGTSVAKSVNVQVVAVNDAPTLVIGGALSYTENRNAIRVAGSATVVDVDSANFSGGVLTVSLTSGAGPTDVLSIRNQGTGTNQIGVNGNAITFAGAPLATFTGGTGGTALTITLGASADATKVRILMRNLLFQATGDAPTGGDRTLSITLSDGDNATNLPATKVITVVALADRPTIAMGGTLTYTENQPARVLASTATLFDSDSPTFEGGKLTARVAVNADPNDRLEIQNQGTTAGKIGTSAGNVTFGGVTIGTFSGGNGNQALAINLNASASLAAVQALIRAITFRTDSEKPSTLVRTINLTVTDDQAVVSNLATKTVNVVSVNDAPILTGGGTTSYTNGSAAALVSSSFTLVDKDSDNFAGGRLLVSFTSGGHTSNLLNVGGLFTFGGTDGNDLIYDGTTKIGARNNGGGTGTTNLSLSFTDEATLSILTQLVRNITFATKTTGPQSTVQRVISFNITDGDGGASNTVTRTVNVN